ncbi:MFS transporter [Paenibacillus sp. MWE-103]|uniref:MFS transporter n=1 Tax=Paenibacillus artemisiicola TaxID=1172618 RepID=A0ABS3WC91_9BACL|nr:MFS transporter [Paenibacillus artemisiicola]MBO7745904.1 MFS transporter [Paenibacillus artemisiicola]
MGKFTALFFLVMFMIGTDTFLISPLIPTLQAEFGVSTGHAGWMIGAYTLGSALFALIAGPLSDGWNRRTVMLCGLLGFSAATALCGFADGFWTMCLLRFLAGVSAAFTAPQVWASIPAVMPASRIPKTMGVAFSGLAASQAFGVPIGSWLAAAHWSVPFWTIGAASLLLAAAVFRLMPDVKPAAAPPGGRAAILRRYAPLAASSRARSGFLAYLLLHLGSGASLAFAGKWMADRFALPVGQIGTVMMFLGLGTLLGSLLGAYPARKLGRANAAAAGLALIAALYVLGPHLGSLPAATALYLLIFALLGMVFPVIMEALTSLNASIRGTISSLANATMNGANTIGAWISGLLYAQLGGYAAIGLFSAVCLLLALGAFLAGGVLAERAPARGGEAAAKP